MNIALALRQAIWRKEDPGRPVCGIPEQLDAVNGSDFVSENIEHGCKIRQVLRTFNDMFLPDIPGHIGAGKPLSGPAP